MRRGGDARTCGMQNAASTYDFPAESPKAGDNGVPEADGCSKIMFKIKNLKCASPQRRLFCQPVASKRPNLVRTGHGYKLGLSGKNEGSDLR